MGVGHKRLDAALRFTDEIAPGHDRLVQCPIGRAIFQNLGHLFAAAVKNEAGATFTFELRG